MNSSDLGRYDGFPIQHSKMIKYCPRLSVSCAFIALSDNTRGIIIVLLSLVFLTNGFMLICQNQIKSFNCIYLTQLLLLLL